MYTKKHGTLALLACAAFLVVTLFSVLFLVNEAGHDCIGKNCSICACIHQAEQTLKQLGMGTACAGSVIPAASLLIFALPCVLGAVLSETPISQKVRLNN